MAEVELEKFRRLHGETRFDVILRRLAGVREILALPEVRERHRATAPQLLDVCDRLEALARMVAAWESPRED